MFCLQSLNELSKDEIKKIIDSIDYVFFDIDGVLLHNKTVLPGAADGVAKLRKLGKKIAFVSNNSVYHRDVLLKNLKLFGATANEIVTPNDSLMAYLKDIGFNKDIYVISCSLPKKVLKEAGYYVIDYKDIMGSPEIEETLDGVKEICFKTLDKCKNVGAVLVDIDLNFYIGAAQAAKIILNHRQDVIFLSGMTDDVGNLNEEMKFIAAKFYIDGLERWTKRKSVTMAKPGLALKVVLSSKYNILEDSRVLFVGDNVHTDISFGANCGYQTLLLLSGVTSKSQVDEWQFPENIKPSYVAESLDEFYEKIKDF